MKRLLAPVLCCVLAACGEETLRVEAELDGQPISDVPVWLLPYDRHALLDSLVQESDEPEPAIPASLVEELEALRSPGTEPVSDSVAAERSRRAAALEAHADSIRLARVAWRDRVHAPLDSLVRRREEAAGFRARVDTTDARGIARLPAPEGRFWVWAVYVVAEGAIEWSVPVVLRGDSATVRLDRGNARERRLY
jgi:hypothetical protein